MPSLAWQRLPDEAGAEGSWQSDTGDHRKPADLVLQGDALTDQLLARDDQRSHRMCR
jgi:hypothetical protein